MEGALKREVMRRRSIETQQIASWKKEQILQDIENLKNVSLGQSTNINAPLAPPDDLKSPNSDAASKLSKLSARKIKNLSANGSGNVRLNFDAIQGELSASKPKYNVGFDLPSDRPEEPFRPVVTNFGTSASSGTAAVASSSNPEVDAMIQEKKYFLSRLNDDNEKMVQLLQDMKECKQRLKATIESVEAERDRLKGYQVDISTSCIDQFLLDGSDGALSALLAVQHSSQGLGEEQLEERRATAETLQQSLLALIARHKANQHEQNELIFGRIQALCTRFAQDPQATAESFDGEIQQLRSVIDVATGPALVNAGDLLSQHIIDAVVEYAVSNKAVSAAASRSNVMLKDPSRSAMKSSEGSGRESNTPTSGSGGTVTISQSELDELMASNESLKASLAKMSKSNAQLRAAAASGVAPSTGSGSTSKKNPSPLKRGQSNSSINNNNSNGREAADDQSDSPAAAVGDGNKHNTSTSSINVPPVSPPKPIKVAPQLPAVVVEFLHAHLTAHIQQLLEGHPIAASGIPADVFLETAKELATQVQSLASTALVSYAHHRGIEDLMACVPAGTAAGAGLSVITDAAIRGVIQDGVKHTVQVAAVHAEITTLATLYLTYLHSRYGNDGRPRSTTPGTTTEHSTSATAAVLSPVVPSAGAAGAGGVSAVNAAFSPHELSSSGGINSTSEDPLDYDPSLGYSGLADIGSGGTPYARGGAGTAAGSTGRLGPVSHGAREYVSRSQSTNNVNSGSTTGSTGAGRASPARGDRNTPRYMQPKRANTMMAGATVGQGVK